MFTLTSFFLIISVILNIILAFFSWKLFFFTIPDREDVIDNYEKIYLQMREFYSKTLESMRRIDLRGAFESDDEVGIAFKFIKKSIEQIDELFEVNNQQNATNNTNQTKK